MLPDRAIRTQRGIWALGNEGVFCSKLKQHQKNYAEKKRKKPYNKRKNKAIILQEEARIDTAKTI